MSDFELALKFLFSIIKGFFIFLYFFIFLSISYLCVVGFVSVGLL